MVDQGVPGFCSLQAVADIVRDPEKFHTSLGLPDGHRMRCLLGWAVKLAHFKDKELASMLTSANGTCGFSTRQRSLKARRCRVSILRQLRNGKMTVYLILPPEHMRRRWGSSVCGSGR